MPWFITTAPTAPAASAFATLTPKLQVPRCSSAIRPVTMLCPCAFRKSAASQPLVDTRGGVRLMSTGTRAAWAVPEPEPEPEPEKSNRS